jgi:F-type H+-transporting ATPase subunit b
VILLSRLPAVLFAALLLSEGGEHAEKFLGLPIWIWELLNLVLFLGLLFFLLAKPLTEAFRKRQVEVEQRRQEAEKRRAAVDRLAADLRERTAGVEREVLEIRKQAVADGESIRAELAQRAKDEAERIRKGAEEEIERRVAAARAQLRQTAADLTGTAATELLAREITDEDRRQLFSDSVARLKDAR